MKKLLFIILILLTINPLISQNTYSINGILIWESEGILYNISSLDTARIDINYITLKYKTVVDSSIIYAIENSNNLNKHHHTRAGNITYRIDLSNVDFIALVGNLVADSNVNNVYFEYILKYSDGDPDDPYYGSMNFDHIHVPEAWNYTTGHPDVIVGVIDNGCNWEHPELTEIESIYGNIFLNTNDPWYEPDNPDSGDDEDNDGNGYWDDYKGWDFLYYDNDVRPDLSEEFHGTAMAGIVAAKTYNGILVPGIAGGWGEEGNVSPGVKILPVRNGDNDGWSTAFSDEAIEYAVDMGAKILNFSWGQIGLEDPDINAAIDYAWENGVIMFAATGNYGPNGWPEVAYPANHENVIAVGGVDGYGICKLDVSNYGPETELTGIGETRVLSTTGIHPTSTGETSGACASASGGTALLLSYCYEYCFELSNSEIRELLKNTAWKSDCNGTYTYTNGHNNKLGYGIIDLEAAFLELTTNYILTEPQSIYGSVEWDKKMRIDADVTVNPGATLSITNEIYMSPGKKIVVMEDGELILNGGKLTNACNGMWLGVEVWGDATIHQFECQGEIKQGKITILNGGTVENAEIGVLLGARDTESEGGFDESKGGGIIQVPYGDNPQLYNAIFRNNTYAVRFTPYQNYTYDPVNCNNLKPVGNLSYFKNCSFVINEEYEGSEWGSHVYLLNVDGIDFHFCTFENNYTETPTGHGINAYGSGFSIEEICDQMISPCPESYQNRSSFTNFYKAVNSLSSGIYTTTVINTDFIDNSIGVYLSDVDFATIILSDFEVGPKDVTTGCSYAIYMNECTGFAIEDNDFEKASSEPGSYFGIYTSNTRSQDEIYRNTFDDFNYANLATGKNWWEDFTWLGLQYLCNENTNNYKDFLIIKDEYQVGGVQSEQGTLSEPAGNKFSPFNTGDFFNLGGYDIDYYFWENDPYQEPDIIKGVIPIEVTPENTCPSHYGGGSGVEGRGLVLGPGEMEEAEQEFAIGLSDYSNVNALYENLIDGGSTEATLTDVETAMPGDMWELRAALLGKSPHLSMDVLKAAADKTEVLPGSVIFEIMAANPDELKKEELITYLEEKEEPLPEYMMDILKQLTGNVTYKTILQQQLAKHGWKKSRAAYDIIRSQLNDTLTDFTELRNWLDNLGSMRADEQIIESFISEGNYPDALALANLIPGLYDLEGDELAEYNHYIDMLDLTLNMSQEGRNVFELDSTEFTTVEFIAENSNGLAGTQAKNILEFAYGQNYCNCPEISDTTGLKSRAVNMDSFRKMSGITLTVEPNPARQWTAFNYSFPETKSIGEIKISDVSGKVIETLTITGKQGQKIWDTRKINSGVYFYTFTVDGITEIGKIVVSK